MKALRTAAFVVGAVALAATGVGLAGSAGLLSLSAATAATVGTIATVANVAAAALSVAASIATPKGSVGGNPTQFKIDKEAGIPVIIGRSPRLHRVIQRIAATLAPPERWEHPPGAVPA